MADNIPVESRAKAMRAVKGRKTSLERRLRGELARLGLRGWRMNDDSVGGEPDFTFAREKVAAFVNGCFWHGCRRCKRPMPATNRPYWAKKIRGNVTRDRRNAASLRRNGWRVIRIWEHEIRTSAGLQMAAAKIATALLLDRGS